ncbi:MAG TPA: beta/gamma crystallin-related protein [Caulobacteraceae bacterium]|jgi:hypothetical protein|nr:beta/gamma crystallin-related protein [Caulobacteraceae bacterium]
MRVLSILFAAILLAALFGAPSAATAAPGGSYRDSCRNLQVYGDILSADCQSGWGWRSSQINYKRCYGDIANQSGQLVCRGDRGPYARNDYDDRYNDGYNDRYDNDYDNGYSDRYRYGYGGPGVGYGQGGRYGGLVLFGGYGFSGPAFAANSDVWNLGNTRFNDRARSVRINRGVWLLCENANFRGRCITLSRSEPDLGRYGMNGAVSSVRRIR